jgi:hypothetical protein
MTLEHRDPNVGEVVSAANQLRALLGEIVGALLGHATTTMQRRRGGFDLDQCFPGISVQRFFRPPGIHVAPHSEGLAEDAAKAKNILDSNDLRHNRRQQK